MPDPVKAAPVAIAVSIGLGILALLLWVLALATLSDLASSDAAGNGYAQAYAAIEIFLLWGLLALITLIAGVKGAVAWPSVTAAAILIPASGIVTFEALELLSRPSLPPFLWPLIIPATVPPLVLAFSYWALIPPLHAIIGPRLAGGFVWGLILLLCLAIVPLQQMRNEADNRVAAALENTMPTSPNCRRTNRCGSGRRFSTRATAPSKKNSLRIFAPSTGARAMLS